MTDKKKLYRTQSKVDTYLNSLTNEKLVKMRTSQLHATLFHDIATIVLKEYEDLDITLNTELSVDTKRSANGLQIEISGYIKVDTGCYLQIDNRYLPEGWKDGEFEISETE